MVGISNAYGMGSYGTNKSGQTVYNAPLSYSDFNAPSGYHNKSSKKQTFEIKVDKTFKNFIKGKFGKTLVGRINSTPISGEIINTASREDEDMGEVYYAKFVEYGYTDRGGNFHEGQRLWRKSRKTIQRNLLAYYKQMPDKFTREDVKEALKKTIISSLGILESITPVKSGLMSKSWVGFIDGEEV